MKKFFLIILSLIVLIDYSYAYKGGIQKQFTPNTDITAAENKVSITYYNSEYSGKKTYYDAMQTCADKNKYYMPGIPGVDSDDCFDIIGYIQFNAPEASEATYRGYMSAAGDLKYFSATDNRPKAGKGVFLADSLCNIDFPGSRAMRYDDMKYLIKNGNMPDLSKPVMVFESIKSITHSDNSIYMKGGMKSAVNADTNWTCSAYSTRALSDRYTPKLKTNTSVDSRILISNSACNADSYIICVDD